MKIVQAQDVSKTYTIGDRQLTVLDNVSFVVNNGEFLVINGSSGSGKSTLLSLMSGLDNPTAGRIWVDQTDITDHERR